MQFTLSMIERAWEAKDPALVDYIVTLACQAEPPPDKPIRQEALTWQSFIHHIMSREFQQKPKSEQMAYRIEQLRLLEADNAEVPLSEQLKLHKIILLLWSDESFYARSVLIETIRRVPLVYGPWRALKHIFKAAEAANDYQLLAEISARLDSNNTQAFSHPTLIYMRRRAWRYLRQLGQNLPACYPEAACQFLAAYTDDTHWAQCWVANHILYHQSKSYGISHFGLIHNKDALKQRAYTKTWQRSPEPLLRLLSQARAENIRRYACDALKHDFHLILRDVEPQWIIELAALPIRSSAIDHFIVWLLQNSPKLEQHRFKALGLHQAVLALLESEESTAQHYAIQYVAAHARDLPLKALLRLAHIGKKELNTLIQQLLGERDARQQIGLDAWAELLDIDAFYDFAAKALQQHFGRKALSPEWFQRLILGRRGQAYRFAKHYLLELHPAKTLGVSYFQHLMEQLNPNQAYADQINHFLLTQLQQLDLNALEPEFVQMALLHPALQSYALDWLAHENYKTKQLPLDFYKALAYEPDFYAHPFIQKLQHTAASAWDHTIHFNPEIAEQVREWLADVRRFSPADLGFEWLMGLVKREEAEYHDFASQLMIKAFQPADFAPSNQQAAPATTEKQAIDLIDLQQQSFLFTGKLKTMTRSEAENKVTAVNGKNANTVTQKLDYLVIGDEGSPLYGNGRKGSKQVKAEKLMAKGASLKIISETAFLQMLAGEQREHSDDTVLLGCENLWSMAINKPDTPTSKFALHYLRHHHPELCLKLTDRPVDPGAELPLSFLQFERFAPLFQHAHSALRTLALEFAEYEFARWSPPAAELIKLSESKYEAVREFVSKALLSEPEAANKRFRLDASQLEPSAVYSFCESRQAQTRQLGMRMIQQHECFQLPESLFQLTESPDRELRHLVVRILWSLYKRYDTTRHWKPSLPLMPHLSKADQAKREAAEQKLGSGLPQRPKNLPADLAALQLLLKRWLYELPPGRLNNKRLGQQLKPLPASQAKKALIETFRDIALEDREFAALILPLFQQFSRSRGAMEQAACLVAATRLQYTHPELTGVA